MLSATSKRRTTSPAGRIPGDSWHKVLRCVSLKNESMLDSPVCVHTFPSTSRLKMDMSYAPFQACATAQGVCSVSTPRTCFFHLNASSRLHPPRIPFHKQKKAERRNKNLFLHMLFNIRDMQKVAPVALCSPVRPSSGLQVWLRISASRVLLARHETLTAER